MLQNLRYFKIIFILSINWVTLQLLRVILPPPAYTKPPLVKIHSYILHIPTPSSIIFLLGVDLLLVSHHPPSRGLSRTLIFNLLPTYFGLYDSKYIPGFVYQHLDFYYIICFKINNKNYINYIRSLVSGYNSNNNNWLGKSLILSLIAKLLNACTYT